MRSKQSETLKKSLGESGQQKIHDCSRCWDSETSIDGESLPHHGMLGRIRRGTANQCFLDWMRNSKDQLVLELYCAQTLGTTKWRGDRLMDHRTTILFYYLLSCEQCVLTQVRWSIQGLNDSGSSCLSPGCCKDTPMLWPQKCALIWDSGYKSFLDASSGFA